MTADSAVARRPTFTRIPALEVDAFLGSQLQQAKERRQAKSILSQAREEAQRERREIDALREELEERLERESDECARRSAEKLRTRNEAQIAVATLTQLAAVVDDYANLSEWIADTIMTGINLVIQELPPDERWSRMITKALDETKERWGLTLTCHPTDHENFLSIISKTNLKDAIVHVQRDVSVDPGLCFLKSNSDCLELNLRFRLEALKKEIEMQFSYAAKEVG